MDKDKPPPRAVQQWMVGQYLHEGLCSRKLAEAFVNRTIGEHIFFERIWFALEDNLLFSSPENFVTKTWVIKRYFRFTMGLLTYGGYGTFYRVLSQGFLHIENLASRKETSNEVQLPGCWPGSHDHKIIFGPDWLVRLLKDGAKEKSQITRLAHLVSKRNFPAPRKEDSKKELIEHNEKLQKKLPAVDPERLEIIRLLGARIAQKVNKRSMRNRAKPLEHISVTNRSSFLSPRSEGGRAEIVRLELEVWANRMVTETKTTSTLWGNTVLLRAGEPNWKNYRIHPLREGEAGCTFLEEYADERGFKIYAGLNRNLGLQLLECAFEAGISRQLWDADGKISQENLPFVRTAVCREPGNKSRIYTIDEWFITILLQPLGHLLVGTLESVTEATHGLKAGNAAWEWTRRFRTKPPELHTYYQGCLLLTSDLETATDYCDLEITKAMLTGYLTELGLLEGNKYLHFALNLLTSGINLVTTLPQ